MFTPKLSSTFTGGIDSKDLQFGGVVLNTKRRNENFDWRFGAYVNSELFSVMIVPLVGFNWKINDAWRLKTLIPVNLELSRIINKKWIAGLLFIGANASYRMRQQLNPFTAFPGSYQPYLDKADNAVSESFFGTLQTELGEQFESHRDAHHQLFEYIEVIYNGARRHFALG